jgi:FkbM family methyltransferase
LGWRVALQLAFIRMRGRSDVQYSVRLPGYAYPVTIRGGRSTDAWAIYELLVSGEYDFLGDLGAPEFIIDGGANIGIASLYFLNRYPSARIVAIEPHPGNFEVCAKNLAPYDKRVRLIQGAIWKESGRLVLDETTHEEWTTRVQSGSADQSGSVEAFTLRSLIAYCNGKVDLLKLDVEGSEKELFGPGAEEWLPAIRNIVIELHGGDCSERFFSALTEYKYDLIQSPKDALPVVACRNLTARANQIVTSA